MKLFGMVSGGVPVFAVRFFPILKCMFFLDFSDSGIEICLQKVRI